MLLQHLAISYIIRGTPFTKCSHKDAVCSLELAFQAVAVVNPEDEDGALPPEVAPKTKKQQLGKGSHEEASLEDAALSLVSSDAAPSPIA